MPNRHSTLTSLFEDIADSIRAKRGLEEDPSSANFQTLVADNFDREIDAIETLDTSDADATAADIRAGASAYVNGEKIVGNMPNAEITSGEAVATITGPTFDSNTNYFVIGAEGTVPAPSVEQAGYISTSEGERNTNIISGSKNLNRIAISVGTNGVGLETPVIEKTTKPDGDTWIDAAGGIATTTLPTEGPYVRVDSEAVTSQMIITPQVDSSGYGTPNSGEYIATQETETVGANASAPTYIPIKTGNPSFDGGAVSGSTSVSGNENVTLSTTNNGIAVTSSGTANREDVLYNGAVDGYVSKADNATALAAPGTAATLNTDTQYITGVTVPKNKGFSLSTESNDSIDSSVISITNNSNRDVTVTNNSGASTSIINSGISDITNSGTASVTSSSKSSGTLNVIAYPSSGDTPDASQPIVQNGKWVTPTISGSNTYYGKVVLGSASLSYKGGSPSIDSESKAATITQSNISVSTESSDNHGITVTAHGSAKGKRSAIQYSSTSSGYTSVTADTNIDNTIGPAATESSAENWDGTTYYVTGLTLPKTKSLSINTEAATSEDNTGFDVTNNAFRRTTVDNEPNGSVLVSNEGSTAITNMGTTSVTSNISSSTPQGTIKINAYPSDTSSTTIVDEETIVENGRWKHQNLAAANTNYYGEVSASPALPTFKGAEPSLKTSSAEASGDGVGLSNPDLQSDPGSGITITTGGSATATRTAVLYKENSSGFLSKSADDPTNLDSADGDSESLSGHTYYVTSITLPKTKTLNVSTEASDSVDNTGFNVTNNTNRRTHVDNESNANLNVSNEGTTTVTNIGTTTITSNLNGSTPQGTINVNAYPQTGTSRVAEKPIVSNGRWNHTDITDAGTYYGEVTVTAESDLTASDMSGATVTESAQGAEVTDYGFKASITIPKGFYNTHTVEKTFSEVFPAPASEGTSNKMLTGYTLYSHDGKAIVGSIDSLSSTTYYPMRYYEEEVNGETVVHDGDQVISQGIYLSGDQTIKGVKITEKVGTAAATLGLSASNIKYGTTVKIGDSANDHRIANITGSYTYVSENAASNSDILEGKKAFVNGESRTGTISSKVAATYNTSAYTTASGNGDQVISSGQYLSGNQTIKAVKVTEKSPSDSNASLGLSASSVRKGYVVKVGDSNNEGRITNVTGTFSAANTVTGTGKSAASAGDILIGKSAFLDGAQINGEMPNNGDVSGTISTQNGEITIPSGYTSGGKIKATLGGASITYKGGTPGIDSNSKSAYVETSGITFSNNDTSGITITPKGSAKGTRTAIQYASDASGYVTVSNNTNIDNTIGPAATESDPVTPWTGTVKYISGVTVNSSKSLTVTNNGTVTVPDTSKGTTKVTTNKVTSNNTDTYSGTVTVRAYTNSGQSNADTYTLTAEKTVASGGKWYVNTVGSGSSQISGSPYYGETRVMSGTHNGKVSSHSISTHPVVESSVSGTVTNIALTSKPSGTDNTDYWTITPSGSVTSSGVSRAKAKAEIGTAGYISSDSGESGNHDINITSSDIDCTSDSSLYIKKGEYGADVHSISVTTIPEVTPSIGGTVTSISSTSKPSGTDGENYWTINPGGSVTTTGEATAVAHANVTTSGYISSGTQTDSDTCGITPSIENGDNRYISKGTPQVVSSVDSGYTSSGDLGMGNYIKIPAGYYPTTLFYAAGPDTIATTAQVLAAVGMA